MKTNIQLLIFSIITVFCLATEAPAANSVTADNESALEGVHTTRSVFDINTGSAAKLNLYLQVIEQTLDTLVADEKSPVFIVAFRGPSVRLITNDHTVFSADEQSTLKQAVEKIRSLKKKGVGFEACSIATGVFSIPNRDIVSEVKVVENTFVSLIGYQSKGYTLVPIQ